MKNGIPLTSKFHPADAEYLSRLVRLLQETNGVMHWDVSIRNKQLLVTESEHSKLYGYLGSIRPTNIDEDCHEIVQAALLRN